MMTDEFKEIFIDEDGDLYYIRSELDEHPHLDFTRYVREDTCFETKEGDTFLKHLPLFNCHADPDGNVWVKIPLKVPES